MQCLQPEGNATSRRRSGSKFFREIGDKLIRKLKINLKLTLPICLRIFLYEIIKFNFFFICCFMFSIKAVACQVLKDCWTLNRNHGFIN